MAYAEFDFTGAYINPNSASADDALEFSMRAQWRKDVQAVTDQGRIPDWIGEPRPLEKDMAALLTYLYEHGYIVWRSAPCQNNAKVASIIGAKTQSAAQATIRKCLDKELIKSRIHRGEPIFEMTMHGEFALDEWQTDQEMGI